MRRLPLSRIASSSFSYLSLSSSFVVYGILVSKGVKNKIEADEITKQYDLIHMSSESTYITLADSIHYRRVLKRKNYIYARRDSCQSSSSTAIGMQASSQHRGYSLSGQEAAFRKKRGRDARFN